MPYLWCHECGTGKEKTFKNNSPCEGESVYLASGELINGGYLCDKCNKPLGVTDKAVYCAFLAKGQTHNTNYLTPYFDPARVDTQTIT